MFAVLLTFAVAAAPTPRVAPSAQQYVFVPRLDRLDALRGFVSVAGKKTSLMRSVIWSAELLPALGVDLMSPESLEAAGVNPQGSLTTSISAAGTIACVTLSRPDDFATRARRALDYGEGKWTGTLPAKTKFHATVRGEGVVTGGFVQRGAVGCVVKSSKGRGGPLMFEAEKLLGVVKPPPSFKNMKPLQGPVYLGSAEAVAVLRGNETSLTVDALPVRLPISTPSLSPAGLSPYANIPHSGVLSLKATVDPTAIKPYARAFAAQLLSFCRKCDAKDVSDVVTALSEQLTGSVYLRAHSLSLDPRGLKSDRGRYFALRHAYFAELKDPAAVKALFAKLPDIKGVLRTDKGLQLRANEGTIELQLLGRHLVIANDIDALSTGARLVAAATPGKLTHGLEAQGDPKPLGRALRKVSLLDALGSNEMAGLFAAGVEFGPLLAATEKVTVWADSGSPMKAQAVWLLEPPPKPAALPAPQPTADGGSGATGP